MAGLVREASSVNIVLQISSRDIENEVARVVTEQRKVSPECSGTTKALDADDPRGDGLQVSVGINLLAHAAANPQPPPLVAGQVEVNEAAAANPQPPPLVAGKVKVDEAAVAVTKDYFIYRMESYVPRNVTCVRIHCSVKFIQYLSLRRDEGHWAHAFDGCKRLIEVVLHEGVKTIGESAFRGCSSLPRIIIPSSVTAIVRMAFYDCSTLVEVVLNDGLQRIGGSAFARCISLIRIDIPPSVTVIDDFAFSYCTALEEVVLHEGLKTIGGSAFIGCRSLIHIVIPRSVTAIGENAFNGCAVSILVGPHFRKHNYRILRGGSSNFKGHFLYSNKSRGLVPKTVTHVLIHYSVESLSRNSFYDYTALVEVVLHDGFRGIADNAFSGCKSLVRIVIPASVTYIGSYAFSRCKGL
jgi:hypothetical protein